MIASMLADGVRAMRGHVIGTDGDELVFGGLRTAAGERVSPETALKVAAVYACVSVIGSGVRFMPCNVVRDDGKGLMTPERPHRLWRLLHTQPNEEMSAGELWERISWDLMLRGNSYGWLERNRLGQVVGVWPLSVGRVEVGRHPITRRKIFAVSAGDDRERVAFMGTTEDILHVKGDPGPDPLLGQSVINRLREIVGRSLAEDRHSATTMKNQGRPSGILKVDGKLDDDQAKRLVTRWNIAHGGSAKAGRTAVLENGATWEAVTLSAADLDLVKQRAISREDIAIAFKVPGDIVLAGAAANLHYSTDATRDVRLVKHAIAPTAGRIQDALEICPSLPWGGELHPRFNPDALLKADIKTRYEAYAQSKFWQTINEIRRREDLPPIQGGDRVEIPPDPPAQQRNGVDPLRDLARSHG